MLRNTDNTKRKYLKIVEIRDEQEHFKTFVFAKPEAWKDFDPGQYMKFYTVVFLPRKVSPPLVLAIASGTNDNHIEVTFSNRSSLFNAKKFLECYNANHYACIDGPLGSGFPRFDAATPLLLIGAGTGVTALRSIKRSVNPGQTVQVIYSAKTVSDIPYLPEVKSWAADRNNYVSLTQEKNVSGFHHGRINSQLQNQAISANTKIFVCGPDGFMQDVVRQLLEKSVAMENIYVSLNKVTANAGPVYQLNQQVLAELNIPHLTNSDKFKKKAR